MPSVTPSELPTFASGRKRRRDIDDDGHVSLTTRWDDEPQNPLGAIDNNRRHISDRDALPSLSMSRNAISIPLSKRFRAVGENQEHMHSPNLCSTPDGYFKQQSQSHLSHTNHENSTPLHTTQTITPKAVDPATALLIPCHICHRKPTKRSDLDSYADCMGCRQRTCFICIRTCQCWLDYRPADGGMEDMVIANSGVMQSIYGPQHMPYHCLPPPYDKLGTQEGGGSTGGWRGPGHRDVVCSRCCIERGSDGEVVCLGCLAEMEGA